MHAHSCADVRERLAIQNHLTKCVTCSLETDEIAALGSTLRVMASEVGEHAAVNRAVVNAMLNEAYHVQFAPAQARTGNTVAVSMVWLVASTTVKGRYDDDLGMLRQTLQLRTGPQPIGPVAVPADAGQPKPQAAPLIKPVRPEAFEAHAPPALAATGP